MYGDRAIPVDSNEGPGERGRDSWPMDEAGVCVVAKVAGRQVGKVDNEQQLGPAKVRAHKQHNEGKVEKIMENVMTTDARGMINISYIRGKEMTNICELEDEENEPVE